MKKILWIFLIIAAIAGVVIYLRKRKAELGLATDIIEAEPKEVLPGTDIPVGLKPIPGIGIITPFPMPMPMPMPAPITVPTIGAVEGLLFRDFFRAELTEGEGFIIPRISKEQIKTRLETIGATSIFPKIFEKLGL